MDGHRRFPVSIVQDPPADLDGRACVESRGPRCAKLRFKYDRRPTSFTSTSAAVRGAGFGGIADEIVARLNPNTGEVRISSLFSRRLVATDLFELPVTADRASATAAKHASDDQHSPGPAPPGGRDVALRYDSFQTRNAPVRHNAKRSQKPGCQRRRRALRTENSS